MIQNTLQTIAEIRTISPADIARLLASGRAIDLIDVRTPAEFAALHADCARLVPLETLDPLAILETRGNAKDEPLYVICQSGARAGKACQKLQAAGLTHVVSVQGGTTAWEREGLPVVRGAVKAISLERQVRIAAGSLVLLGLLLGWLVHPGLYFISAFIGGGLLFAGITDWCGMGMLLAKMPWNQAKETATKSRAADLQGKPKVNA